MKESITTTPTSNATRRATGYLRWYPRVWRERYGEEFVAHLEYELEERPMSLSRSLNIALHGVTSRFKLQSGVRWVCGIGLTLVVVVAVVAGVLGAGNRNIGVPLSLNTSGSIGVPVTPKSVTNINFQFTDRSMKAVRVTNIALIGFRGDPVPRVVRVQFDPTRQGKSFTIDPSDSIAGLVPAFGRRILLGNGDSILVSLKAPVDGRLYAVDGLRLTYVRRGTSYVKTLSLKQSPQLLCVEPRLPVVGEPRTCDREFTTAWSIAEFYEPLESNQPIAQREAFLATNAAFDYVTGFARRGPDLANVRHWAKSLFAHRGSWRIVRVTSSRSDFTVLGTKHALLFHFELRNRSTDTAKTICVLNGGFDSGGGFTGPSLSSCHE